MPVNPEFNNMREGANNLRLIKKYMNILEANYSRKKEETIRAIQDAGYTVEDIRAIKERYCGSTGVTLDFGYRHLDEMKEIAEKLKTINEKVIYDGKRNNEASLLASDQIVSENTDNSRIEHVEAEIVPEEEVEQMRRRHEQMKEQRETERMFRMVNEHSNQVKAEKAAYASVGASVAAGSVAYASSGTRSRDFRKKVADMARETESSTSYRNREDIPIERSADSQATGYRSEGKRADSSQRTGTRNSRRGGKRLSSDRENSGRRSRPGAHLPKRNLKNKPKTSGKKSLVRRLVAGALAVSVLAGAYLIHKNNEYEKDVENRIEYVDNIIDRNGTAQDYKSLCGIDFTDEELDKFIEIEGKIESYAGKESTDLSVVDIIMTAGEFGDFYRDIVRERLEEGFGYSIEDNEIKVTRERDDLDGHPGDYNENGHISQIGYMEHINNKNIPKELLDSVIAAFGGQGIEKPAMSVEELIYKLDNQEITKSEAGEILNDMLDDAKELMTRQYEEKSYGELEEKESTYDIVKEREEEQARTAQANGQENVQYTNAENEIDR